MTRFRGRRFPVTLFLVMQCVAVTWNARPARASKALRDELGNIANQVATILAASRETAIGIGAFTGPATFPASAGPGVAQILKEELKSRGIETDELRTKFGLKGSFSFTQVEVPSVSDFNQTDKFIGVKVTVEMVDQFGQPIAAFNAVGQAPRSQVSVELRDDETITQLVGLTTSIDPTASSLKRNEQLRDQITGNAPAGDLRGTQLFADSTSPYGIEILVNGQPRSMSLEQGFVFTPLDRDEIFTVRLINNDEFDAAVALTLDGVSTFAFCTERRPDGSPAFEHYLVPAGGSTEVKGWFRDQQTLEEFLITAFEDGVAFSLNQTSNVGTITARFHAAWPKEGPRPRDEPGSAKGVRGLGRNAFNAIGRGQQLQQNAQTVAREIGVLRSSVSVRYQRP